MICKNIKADINTNTIYIGSMCRKCEVDYRFTKLVTLILPHVTKFCIFFLSKHLKVKHEIPILDVERNYL